ncbi:hypothetical protein EHN06_07405 [Marinobacter sp. NP-4(2019)]|uniref:hypothetical protein n=1 Tax=Marinobacter sp. NP-4(2019) TaxID=2488665 RepID=UPI000FC3ECBB|nr:hypothetical protein [Marinobacter sp. NP-4(2019)]AZT83387.1 hypothetical protein EHN06_07405 [Marinobacter sp. NP-4(2019)]
MEDWQGCLSPLCQTALQRARDHVAHRGGFAITVEDFLLALLEGESVVAGFLKARGVDLDELVRTVQCEQPIVTEVGGEGSLSSQLLYWFSSARELSDAPWLDWPVLFSTLAGNAERLQEKAYVSVLELVGEWPLSGWSEEAEAGESPDHIPVVVSDLKWLSLAEEVAVTIAAAPDALIWLRGDRGTGKSSWLQSLLPCLENGYVELDLRRESELMASDHPAVPTGHVAQRDWPVLILDNVSPADAVILAGRRDSFAAQLVLSWQGALLLLGPSVQESTGAVTQLESWLGRSMDIFDMPDCGYAQKKSVLIAHQPAIEKHWNIRLSGTAINYVAGCRSRAVGSPGGMLRWVERAAARLSLYASRGPVDAVVLAGQMDTLRRQCLVSLARDEPLEELESSLTQLEIERAAVEVAWHEREALGTLRTLTVEDLQQELERWVAARPGPVHYVVHCDHDGGETTGAGPRNIHS